MKYVILSLLMFGCSSIPKTEHKSDFVKVTIIRCDETMGERYPEIRNEGLDRNLTTCAELYKDTYIRKDTIKYKRVGYHHLPIITLGEYTEIKYNIPFCIIGLDNSNLTTSTLETCESLE